MAKCRKLFAASAGVTMSLLLFVEAGMTAQASGTDYLDNMRGGIASVLNPGSTNSADVVSATARELNIELETQEEEEIGNLVMANVQNALNVRSDASEEASKVGKLYKDCGGIVLERRDGWTKLQSGNIVGWASDEYLLFGEDAREMKEEIRIREEAEREAKRHVNYGAYTTDADTTLLLAALIQCEAGGESYEGQVAVGAVVMNRVRSGAYPNSIHGVIYAV